MFEVEFLASYVAWSISIKLTVAEMFPGLIYFNLLLKWPTLDGMSPMIS